MLWAGPVVIGELDDLRIEYNITVPGTYYVQVSGQYEATIGPYILHVDGPGAGSTTNHDDHGFSAWNATSTLHGRCSQGKSESCR